MRRIVLIFPAAALFAACGGNDARAPEPAPTAEPKAPAVTDSMPGAPAPRGDSARPTGGAKAEGPLRDSAFGPKFAVDSTGKVVPIKKP
jgi:hypothetical protein